MRSAFLCSCWLLVLLFSCGGNPSGNNTNEEQSNEFQIVSFWVAEEIELMAGPVIQVDYAVLQVSAQEIKGYVGWASQGEAEYFISGKLYNRMYMGDVYYLGCDQDCANPMGKFQLEISDLKLKLSGDARVDHPEIPIYNGKHFFHGGVETDVLREPDVNAQVLLTDIANNPDMAADILEIGKRERINGKYDLWYKVKIGDIVGWVRGGLCTVCPGSEQE